VLKRTAVELVRAGLGDQVEHTPLTGHIQGELEVCTEISSNASTDGWT
jgi:hypothetical protein